MADRARPVAPADKLINSHSPEGRRGGGGREGILADLGMVLPVYIE